MEEKNGANRAHIFSDEWMSRLSARETAHLRWPRDCDKSFLSLMYCTLNTLKIPTLAGHCDNENRVRFFDSVRPVLELRIILYVP